MIRRQDLPAQTGAHGRLMAKLHDLQGSGDLIPCVGDARWVSDDPAVQTEAAGECGDCPALAACRRYFDAWPEPAGVWAGLTERARDGRRSNGGRPARRVS